MDIVVFFSKGHQQPVVLRSPPDGEEHYSHWRIDYGRNYNLFYHACGRRCGVAQLDAGLLANLWQKARRPREVSSIYRPHDDSALHGQIAPLHASGE